MKWIITEKMYFYFGPTSDKTTKNLLAWCWFWPGMDSSVSCIILRGSLVHFWAQNCGTLPISFWNVEMKWILTENTSILVQLQTADYCHPTANFRQTADFPRTASYRHMFNWTWNWLSSMSCKGWHQTVSYQAFLLVKQYKTKANQPISRRFELKMTLVSVL